MISSHNKTFLEPFKAPQASEDFNFRLNNFTNGYFSQPRCDVWIALKTRCFKSSDNYFFKIFSLPYYSKLYNYRKLQTYFRHVAFEI